MQLELETLRETPEGEAVVIHRFRPAGGARVKLENVAVLGVGQVRFGVHSEDARASSSRATRACSRSPTPASTCASVSEAFVGYIQPAAMLGIRAMKEFGLTGLPVTHVENASATGLVAFREAAHAVASGRAQVALALGFDKMSELARGGQRRARRRAATASTR